MFIKSGIYFLDHNLMHCLATVHCIMIALVKKSRKCHKSIFQVTKLSIAPPDLLARWGGDLLVRWGVDTLPKPHPLDGFGTSLLSDLYFSFSKVGSYGCI